MNDVASYELLSVVILPCRCSCPFAIKFDNLITLETIKAKIGLTHKTCVLKYAL